MTIHLRRFGEPNNPAIVLVAGFGDHGGMFELLGPTDLGEQYSLVAVDLPGTGHSAPLSAPLTLQRAATLVADVVDQEAAHVIVGHSVGSIVASLAAHRTGSPIDTVLSIEGNLTLADAYFSGSAAEYDSPAPFREALLTRLADLAVGNPTIARYRNQVAQADATSIWELGCDTRRWSLAQHPGQVLASSAGNVHYLFNPDNTPTDSLEWLSHQSASPQSVSQHQREGASHWESVDRPDLLAKQLLLALGHT